NYDKIPYFNNANPIKNFYDKTYRSTSLLIIRNKNRLIKEISQSKELLILLKKSTHTDLSHDEKKIVKRQLMDIFKSIPSLAIFAIPGGSVLLPIIIKLIPTLLPSAFNENLEEN
ncbi:MAG: LETM1 domain-containing protein, partial [Psychroflexus sp.]